MSLSRGDVESSPVSVAPVQVGDAFRDLDCAEVLGLGADNPDAVRHPGIQVPAIIDLDPVRSIFPRPRLREEHVSAVESPVGPGIKDANLHPLRVADVE